MLQKIYCNPDKLSEVTTGLIKNFSIYSFYVDLP